MGRTRRRHHHGVGHSVLQLWALVIIGVSVRGDGGRRHGWSWASTVRRGRVGTRRRGQIRLWWWHLTHRGTAIHGIWRHVRVLHRVHEWRRHVSARWRRAHSGHHRLSWVVRGVRVHIRPPRSNLASGRVVFVLRWGHRRRRGMSHGRRLLLRWGLQRREHLHIALAVVRPCG